MIVFSRRKNESIVIGENAEITLVVVEVRGDKVRLGVEAPKEIPVHRREVFEAIQRENQSSRRLEGTVAQQVVPQTTAATPQKTQYQLFVERLNFGEYVEAGRIYNESPRNFEASHQELDKLSKGLYTLIQSK